MSSLPPGTGGKPIQDMTREERAELIYPDDFWVLRDLIAGPESREKGRRLRDVLYLLQFTPSTGKALYEVLRSELEDMSRPMSSRDELFAKVQSLDDAQKPAVGPPKRAHRGPVAPAPRRTLVGGTGAKPLSHFAARVLEALGPNQKLLVFPPLAKREWKEGEFKREIERAIEQRSDFITVSRAHDIIGLLEVAGFRGEHLLYCARWCLEGNLLATASDYDVLTAALQVAWSEFGGDHVRDIVLELGPLFERQYRNTRYATRLCNEALATKLLDPSLTPDDLLKLAASRLITRAEIVDYLGHLFDQVEDSESPAMARLLQEEVSKLTRWIGEGAVPTGTTPREKVVALLQKAVDASSAKPEHKVGVAVWQLRNVAMWLTKELQQQRHGTGARSR